MVSTVIPVQPFDLVIFGATGDLAHRKILPSLYRRLAVHQMPPSARVIGAARTKMTAAEFRKSVRDVARRSSSSPRSCKPELVERVPELASTTCTVDATGEGGWAQLAQEARREARPHPRLLPLGRAVALRRPSPTGWPQAGVATPSSRIVVEKPLGHDLASARALNAAAPQALRRAPDLPDRPLPRQGDGAEPDGDPLRQRAVRAALERALRRPRADHRGRDRSASPAAASTTTSPAPCATWCRTT